MLARDAPAVAVRDLRKSYADVEAVRGVTFEVRRGEIFALLGPNGAGKTSVIEMLEGYRRRTAGDTTVLGVDPAGPRAAGASGSVSCSRNPSSTRT